MLVWASFSCFSHFFIFFNFFGQCLSFCEEDLLFQLTKKSIFELLWKFWTAHFSLKLVPFTTRKWNIAEILRRGYGQTSRNPRYFFGGGVEKLPYFQKCRLFFNQKTIVEKKLAFFRIKKIQNTYKYLWHIQSWRSRDIRLLYPPLFEKCYKQGGYNRQLKSTRKNFAAFGGQNRPHKAL